MPDLGEISSTLSRRICVFCGASSGASPLFESAARELGSSLALAGIGVVYGAGGSGVMGALSDAVLASEGEIIGVIPEVLMSRERGRHDLPDLRIVGSIQERKSLMHDLSDGFIVMPGGLGTLEELFEVVTLTRLGLHDKPIVILNVAGYFDPLLTFLDHAQERQFLSLEDKQVLSVATSVPEAMAHAGMSI